MEKFVKRMIIEHKELLEKINKLENYMLSETGQKDDREEFADKAVQLSAMKVYAGALCSRIERQNVYTLSDSNYFALVDLAEEPENNVCNNNDLNTNGDDDL